MILALVILLPYCLASIESLKVFREPLMRMDVNEYLVQQMDAARKLSSEGVVIASSISLPFDQQWAALQIHLVAENLVTLYLDHNEFLVKPTCDRSDECRAIYRAFLEKHQRNLLQELMVTPLMLSVHLRHLLAAKTLWHFHLFVLGEFLQRETFTSGNTIHGLSAITKSRLEQKPGVPLQISKRSSFGFETIYLEIFWVLRTLPANTVFDAIQRLYSPVKVIVPPGIGGERARLIDPKTVADYPAGHLYLKLHDPNDGYLHIEVA